MTLSTLALGRGKRGLAGLMLQLKVKVVRRTHLRHEMVRLVLPTAMLWKGLRTGALILPLICVNCLGDASGHAAGNALLAPCYCSEALSPLGAGGGDGGDRSRTESGIGT